MNPPSVYEVTKPIIHNTISTAAIDHNMRVPLSPARVIRAMNRMTLGVESGVDY
jgi:hypothetical protein